MRTGSVLFVGAGPGDPKLLTIKGQEALQRADVIVYDRLANPLLLSHARSGTKLVYCGKEADRHTLPQEEINSLLVREAMQGQTVVRLKGGDPSMFGRVGEEAQTCNMHGIPYEIVPGITSGMAAPLYAGIPLTHRDFNSSVAFVTGHLCEKNAGKEPDWAALASIETLVIYMGVKNLAHICERLLFHGKSPQTPVALVRWGTLGDQETLTGQLDSVAEQAAVARFSAPAIIVIGEVVRLRSSLNWYESKPLFGQTVAVASRQDKKAGLAAVLESLGAEVLPIPLEMRAYPASAEGKGIPDDLGSYQWLVFGDAQQVSFFFLALRERRIDIRQLKAKMVACSLSAAKELESRGFFPEHVIAANASSTKLPLLLPVAKGDRILSLENGTTSVTLYAHGAVIHIVQAGSWEWEKNHSLVTWLTGQQYDWIAAEDGYTLAALADFAGADWKTIPIVCVGGETARRARDAGWLQVIECPDEAEELPSVLGLLPSIRPVNYQYS